MDKKLLFDAVQAKARKRKEAGGAKALSLEERLQKVLSEGRASQEQAAKDKAYTEDIKRFEKQARDGKSKAEYDKRGEEWKDLNDLQRALYEKKMSGAAQGNQAAWSKFDEKGLEELKNRLEELKRKPVHTQAISVNIDRLDEAVQNQEALKASLEGKTRAEAGLQQAAEEVDSDTLSSYIEALTSKAESLEGNEKAKVLQEGIGKKLKDIVSPEKLREYQGLFKWDDIRRWLPSKPVHRDTLGSDNPTNPRDIVRDAIEKRLSSKGYSLLSDPSQVLPEDENFESSLIKKRLKMDDLWKAGPYFFRSLGKIFPDKSIMRGVDDSYEMQKAFSQQAIDLIKDKIMADGATEEEANAALANYIRNIAFNVKHDQYHVPVVTSKQDKEGNKVFKNLMLRFPVSQNKEGKYNYLESLKPEDIGITRESTMDLGSEAAASDLYYSLLNPDEGNVVWVEEGANEKDPIGIVKQGDKYAAGQLDPKSARDIKDTDKNTRFLYRANAPLAENLMDAFERLRALKKELKGAPEEHKETKEKPANNFTRKQLESRYAHEQEALVNKNREQFANENITPAQLNALREELKAKSADTKLSDSELRFLGYPANDPMLPVYYRQLKNIQWEPNLTKEGFEKWYLENKDKYPSTDASLSKLGLSDNELAERAKQKDQSIDPMAEMQKANVKGSSRHLMETIAPPISFEDWLQEQKILYEQAAKDSIRNKYFQHKELHGDAEANPYEGMVDEEGKEGALYGFGSDGNMQLLKAGKKGAVTLPDYAIDEKAARKVYDQMVRKYEDSIVKGSDIKLSPNVLRALLDRKYL